MGWKIVLNCMQAYFVMFYLFDELYWKSTKKDILGALLGSLNPSLFSFRIPKAWEHWCDAVKLVTVKNVLTHDEAQRAIEAFLEYYINEFGFDLEWMLKEIKSLLATSEIWLSFVKKAFEATKEM